LYVTDRMGGWEKWGCEQVIWNHYPEKFVIGIESRSTRRKEWGKK